MKKTFLLLVILLIPFTIGLTISDDFNRPDSQDISYGYEGGFKYYETPIYELDNLIPYNGEPDVFIQDGKLVVRETGGCDTTGAYVSFSHLINITKAVNGSIEFDLTNSDNAGSNRWISYIVFGDNLQNTPAFSKSCEGFPDHKQWWTTGVEDTNKKNFIRLYYDRTYPNDILLGGSYCGANHITLPEISNSESYHIKLNFDLKTNTTTLIINNAPKLILACNLQKATRINSITFEVLTNQGYVIPQTTIDNLKVTVPEKKVTINPLLEKYSPVFYMQSREPYHINELASFMNYADLRKGSELVSNAPTTIDQIKDLEQSNKYYMDMNNVDVNTPFDYPDPEDFSTYQPKVYTTIVEDENFKYLQYFVFYPFQKWYIMNHEGDFGLIQITLDKSNDIHSIGYFFNLFSMWFYDIDLVDFVDGTHPVVIVGKGSHNNFPDEDIIEVPSLLKKIEFFYDLMNDLKSLESLDKGIPYVYGDVDLEDSMSYDLESVKLAWMSYEGLFGQKTISRLTSGPHTPKYDPVFSRHWFHPETHAQGPNVPFIGVFIYSPVDVTVLAEGKQAEYDLYTGPEAEPEAIIVTGKANHTLVLKATDEGLFTLHLYYYDNETDTGIMLKYKNISIIQKSTGKIDANIDSDYILYLDFDGDDNVDKLILPKDYVIYGDFILPDMDKDGVNNFDDNCPFIPNTDQLDTNENGMGDACDSPKYYKEQVLEQIDGMAEKKLYNALNEPWIDSFTPTTFVFVEEQIASRKIDKDLSMLLAKADRMIAEHKINTYIPKNNGEKTRIQNAREFMQKGDEFFDVEDYTNAIMYYGKAWIIL